MQGHLFSHPSIWRKVLLCIMVWSLVFPSLSQAIGHNIGGEDGYQMVCTDTGVKLVRVVQNPAPNATDSQTLPSQFSAHHFECNYCSFGLNPALLEVHTTHLVLHHLGFPSHLHIYPSFIRERIAHTVSQARAPPPLFYSLGF